MNKKNDIIIEFDNIEYSDEERNLLWGKLLVFLAKADQEQKSTEYAKSNKKTIKEIL